MSEYKNDVILILILLVCAGLFFGGIALLKRPGAYVCIAVNGETVKMLPLSGKEQRETVTQPDGKENVIVIKDGKVRVTEASCPDKLCMHQGEISSAGQSIICLPNKLTVTVSGASEQGTPDVLTQ